MTVIYLRHQFKDINIERKRNEKFRNETITDLNIFFNFNFQ
jgi:hypothetical protein